MNTNPVIRLHANDNVLIARAELALGQQLSNPALRVRAQVPAGHKIAACAIAGGEGVATIARAVMEIKTRTY